MSTAPSQDIDLPVPQNARWDNGLIRPITARISRPRPDDVKRARLAVHLTQAEAAQLVSPAQLKPYRAWQGFEAEVGKIDHRAIPLATWELFLLLTGQHPDLCVNRKLTNGPGCCP